MRQSQKVRCAMSKDVGPTIGLHQVSEFLHKLEDAGLTPEDVQRTIDSRDNKIAPAVVQAIRDFYQPIERSKALDLFAQTILFRDLKPLLSDIKGLFVQPPPDDFSNLQRVPFPVHLLRSRAENSILMPVGPVRLREICRYFPRYIDVSSNITEHNIEWDRLVSNEWKWVLFQKSVLDRSPGYSSSYHEDFAEQARVQVASTVEALYCTLMWFLIKKEKLFPDVLVTGGGHWVSNPGGNPRILCIGEFSRDRIRVVDAEVPGPGIGAAAIIRPNFRRY